MNGFPTSSVMRYAGVFVNSLSDDLKKTVVDCIQIEGRKAVVESIKRLDKAAKATKNNPWDDYLVIILKTIAGIND